MSIPTIRRLRAADIQACIELAVHRDWLPEIHKWRLLERLGVVYGAEVNGELVGTVISVPFGRDANAISMMLVNQQWERRGLGTRLMRRVLADNVTPGAFLAATPHGRPLYERLGYRAVGEATVVMGRFAPTPPSESTRPAAESDLAAISVLDRRATGLDRRSLLHELPTFCHQLRVATADDAIVGYCGAWRNVGHSFIGPVVAESLRWRRSSSATRRLGRLA